ncbi:adenylosuccinate synthase [Peptostreptococcus stomatis]|uniref:Adenylosuccinate synthetase n=1 Tax=Peptostreptococcus stomatis DSM 17678 TaxID=596315 RepID=E0E4Z3_9FIRM|nr:adenylosuccinate synthase [Peptostreptococcus stomatis]EFM64061.1 adenylosuccinate synthase [Peptostreptococcus stomatis DSM 17678]MBL6466059.1 adenylosuccinate synthase [Peptostreptococcus stomatis]
MLTAITGINWGDEGKGRMVDLLSEDYDIVVRYQGGNNAGHTVVNDRGKFILNLLPSGILRPDVVNVIGNGVVVDIKHLVGEINKLRGLGIEITPDNLKLSDRAVIVMPYHVDQDCLEEDRLADAKFGSTKRGIAPVYGDKYMKKGIRLGDLLDSEEDLKERLRAIIEWKNLLIEKGYGIKPIIFEDMWSYLKEYGDIVKDYVCDTGLYLNEANKEGKNIMFEAQLGALRDIDFGIYPFTSSSSTIAPYAPIGAGVPNLKLTNSVGIMKAYSTCVGEGPFTAEIFGDKAEELRKAGNEYGAATGRPRRVGGFDILASRYGVRAQGSDVIALTKLDVLSYMEEIPVCVAYKFGDQILDEFPIGEKLFKAEPVYEYKKGWMKDISGCRRLEDLPNEAIDYIKYLEEVVDCKIKYVSVGPERDQYIVMA